MIGGRGINNNEGGLKRDFVTLESYGKVTSRIFVKESEGSSEKILKYVKCTYGRISVPRPKNKFTIYACTIFVTFKLIELERYSSNTILFTCSSIFLFRIILRFIGNISCSN